MKEVCIKTSLLVLVKPQNARSHAGIPLLLLLLMERELHHSPRLGHLAGPPEAPHLAPGLTHDAAPLPEGAYVVVERDACLFCFLIPERERERKNMEKGDLGEADGEKRDQNQSKCFTGWIYLKKF